MSLSLLFLEYPPCSTCKKAKSWLDAHGVQYPPRHIKDQNPSKEELKAWFSVSEKIRSNLEQYQGKLCREGQKKW